MLSQKARREIEGLVQQYPAGQSALLPALCLAQKEYGGWLPERALEEVAGLLALPPALVASTASFYSMLQTRPAGRHVVQVCTNISCSLLGAEHLLEYVGRKLGVGPGETTADGRFTLLEVECLGSCGTAPAMQVDDAYYENLTEEKIDQALESVGQGGS